MGGCQNSLKSFKPDLDRNKLGLNLVQLQNKINFIRGVRTQKHWINNLCNNMKKPMVGFIAGVTAPAGKRMGHAGALISGGADTADAKLAVMEECGFKVTRNPSEMAALLKAML